VLECVAAGRRGFDVAEQEDSEAVLANLSGLSDEELRKVLDELYEEEQRVSYRRRVLHGKIDIIGAELFARLKASHGESSGILTARDLERLTDILAREFSGQVSGADLGDEDVF
jgi:hypothetical protein